MTIESSTDEKVISRVENQLKESIFEISSRRSTILAVIDKLDLKIVCGLAKRMGIPEEEIQSEIDKGKGII